MNTNNAPERIELPNGCYLSLTRSPMGNPLWYDLMAGDDTVIFRGNGSTSGIKEQIAFAAAMQPQVSESDEAVAYEIRKKVYDLLERHQNASSGFFAIDEMIDCAIAAILARRQPAAVSADAVEVARKVGQELPHPLYQADLLKHFDVNAAAETIQTYGDAFRLDGARKYRDAMREKLVQRMGREEYGHAKAAVSLDIEELDALSPETVCGGE